MGILRMGANKTKRKTIELLKTHQKQNDPLSLSTNLSTYTYICILYIHIHMFIGMCNPLMSGSNYCCVTLHCSSYAKYGVIVKLSLSPASKPVSSLFLLTYPMTSSLCIGPRRQPKTRRTHVGQRLQYCVPSVDQD